jgi:hypothetical protein
VKTDETDETNQQMNRSKTNEKVQFQKKSLSAKKQKRKTKNEKRTKQLEPKTKKHMAERKSSYQDFGDFGNKISLNCYLY